MASESLYRKWRSQTFSDMVGQEPVIKTLKNALNTGKLAHAYLFTGPRGTGKTSTARLLAKTINCSNPQNGEPCNVCDQCREITAGSSFNVIEIDAASNRGIDSIRELREKVMMPPTTGKYKVYILDEAHMLTTEAFNALLKTLEEPPPHAIFVMATTDVHKLLPTVLSRCQRFDFKRFSLRQLVDRLHFVAREEQVELQPGSAELIARAASGGMRDALSLLDQSIAYAGNVIALSQVQAMLGVADPRAIQKLIAYIADLDSPAGLHLINELSEAGADLRQINIQVAEYWRAMMLGRAGANIAEILDNTDNEIKEIMEVAKRFTLVELTECARVFAQNDLLQKSQASPQLGLELALLNCIEIHRSALQSPQQPATMSMPAPRQSPNPAPSNGYGTGPSRSESPAMPAAPEYGPGSTNGGHTAATNKEKTVAQPTVPPTLSMKQQQPLQSQQQTSSQSAAAPAPSSAQASTIDWQALNQMSRDVTPAAAPVENGAKQENEAPSSVEVETAEQSDLPTLHIDDVKEHWELVRRRVRTRKDGGKISALLVGYRVVGVEGTSALPIVVCQAQADFHFKTLQNEEYHETIRWALKVTLEMECNIRLLPPNTRYTPPPVVRRPGISTEIRADDEDDSPPDGSGGSKVPSPQGPAPTSPFPKAVPQTPRDFAEAPLHVDTAPAVPYTPQTALRKDEPPASEPLWMPESPSPAATTGPSLVREAHTEPLARSVAVSENTISRPVVASNNGSRREVIEKQARSNPVVLEAVRIFKAEIKDIQPK